MYEGVLEFEYECPAAIGRCVAGATVSFPISLPECNTHTNTHSRVDSLTHKYPPTQSEARCARRLTTMLQRTRFQTLSTGFGSWLLNAQLQRVCSTHSLSLTSKTRHIECLFLGIARHSVSRYLRRAVGDWKCWLGAKLWRRRGWQAIQKGWLLKSFASWRKMALRPVSVNAFCIRCVRFFVFFFGVLSGVVSLFSQGVYCSVSMIISTRKGNMALS